MLSWSKYTIKLRIAIDVISVVLLFRAVSTQMGHSKAPTTGADHNNSDIIPGDISGYGDYQSQTMSRSCLSLLIILTSLRTVLGSMILIPGCSDGDTTWNPVKLNYASIIISLVNILLSMIMIVLYHQGINVGLNNGVDIETTVKQHSIELIIGLLGIAINVSAIFVTCGYQRFQDIESHEERKALLHKDSDESSRNSGYYTNKSDTRSDRFSSGRQSTITSGSISTTTHSISTTTDSISLATGSISLATDSISI